MLAIEARLHESSDRALERRLVAYATAVAHVPLDREAGVRHPGRRRDPKPRFDEPVTQPRHGSQARLDAGPEGFRVVLAVHHEDLAEVPDNRAPLPRENARVFSAEPLDGHGA